jgi:Ca2+:H+ antiporter
LKARGRRKNSAQEEDGVWAPVLVLASYFMAPQPLNLVFSRGLLGAIFLTVLIGVMVAGDGKAHWCKGMQLITVYLIMAVMFYFLPGSQ